MERRRVVAVLGRRGLRMSGCAQEGCDDDASVDGPAGGTRDSAGPRQTIVAFPNGPLLVRGDFDIVDPDGNQLRRSRKTVALCRCGASTLKPYCDGSHKMINFRTEPEN
ncbi:CDGSH iron-sulfur domain-containing protein [Arthrobacter sp. Bz4]|uniref:CDGSH iron-sulfur domain-containing protein n=1 Tax=Arthrobacter sp. Bz4 TaxID=2171979 RepID=UPI00325F9D95